MSYKVLLTQECSIYRKTVYKNDEYGHTNQEWQLLYENVSCRIDYQFITSAYLSQTPTGHLHGNDYIGFFNSDTDIQEGDKIVWQGRTLYARPVNPVFGKNSLHHLEVAFGLQET
jgi:hypothetical protein